MAAWVQAFGALTAIFAAVGMWVYDRWRDRRGRDSRALSFAISLVPVLERAQYRASAEFDPQAAWDLFNEYTEDASEAYRILPGLPGLLKQHFAAPEQRRLLLQTPGVFVLDIERDLRDVVVWAYYHHVLHDLARAAALQRGAAGWHAAQAARHRAADRARLAAKDRARKRSRGGLSLVARAGRAGRRLTLCPALRSGASSPVRDSPSRP